MEDPAVTNALYWLSWMPVLRIIAGAFVAVGVVLQFAESWMSEPWRKIVDDAREMRIAQLTKETTQLSSDAIAARAAVAEANKQTELAKKDAAVAEQHANEAKLALEKFKAPRVLNPEQLSRIIEKMRPYARIPFDFSIQTDPEAIDLMVQLGDALTTAGLTWVAWHDRAPSAAVFTQPGKPQAGIVSFSGLAIQVDDSKTADWGDAVKTLRDALNFENVDASAKRLTDNSVTATAIHIYIGRKPQ